MASATVEDTGGGGDNDDCVLRRAWLFARTSAPPRFQLAIPCGEHDTPFHSMGFTRGNHANSAEESCARLAVQGNRLFDMARL